LRYTIAIFLLCLAAAELVIPAKTLRTSSGGDADRVGLPRVMFWAWERPDDLRGLDPRNAGVAFLAGTIYLRPEPAEGPTPPDDAVIMRPRLQPLYVAPQTPLMAVIRIETPDASSVQGYRTAWEPGREPSPDQEYGEAQRHRVVEIIATLASAPRVQAVQIDFDAAQSERGFYRLLLEDLRRRLPHEKRLSITALASWCVRDAWLGELAPGTIDEAVPMLFRMGPRAADIRELVKNGGEFPVAACRDSVGVSTDEPFSQEILSGRLPGNSASWGHKRIYVFHSGTWAKESIGAAIGELRQWHGEF
jgi:hypothetical protein